MKKLEFQYYYKQDNCPAQGACDETCICWHEEGTGPCKSERHDAEVPLVEWRIKPANAQVQPQTRRETKRDET